MKKTLILMKKVLKQLYIMQKEICVKQLTFCKQQLPKEKTLQKIVCMKLFQNQNLKMYLT